MTPKAAPDEIRRVFQHGGVPEVEEDPRGSVRLLLDFGYRVQVETL